MPELALVTGGETGIGKAIVGALESEGYEVITASRRTGWDLMEPGSATRLIDSLTRLDLLVNNAGIAESAPFAKTSDEMWAFHLELNASVPFRLCRAALPLLRQSANGRIINIASTAALRGAPYIAAYTASKHALLGLTRALAAELKDVKVHAVCPGFADTELTDRSVAKIVKLSGMTAEAARAALAKQNPCGHLITPQEIADAVVSLAGHESTGEELLLE